MGYLEDAAVAILFQWLHAKCYETQRSWPDPSTAPFIVDKVGSILCEEELDALENVIKAWSASKLTGKEAWEVIQKKVLRGQRPATIGLESMVRAVGNTVRCGSEHREGFERPMFGAGIVAVEAQSIFEFLENLFTGGLGFENAWIEAMKGLGVKVPLPDP